MIRSIISKIIKPKGENKTDNNPVVCGCYKVTELDLINAVNNGAKSFEDVQAGTKVGTGCGRCSDGVKVLVDNLILKRKIDENQVVCGCFKVSVQDLVKAIKNGAKSFEEVQAITKVGTGCGNCVVSNRALVAQLLAK
jgi:NAD(P)H-nitrite reductase large subunit